MFGLKRDKPNCCFFFQLLTHIFETLPLFFFFLLHTNPRIAHTKCKMPHISCKMKHCIQNITNTSQKQTFVLCCKHLCLNILFLDISYTHSFSKPNALLSWAFLYKIESNWQRDVEKFTVHTIARLKPNYLFFYCKHLWLWIQYYTVWKKIITSTMCSWTETMVVFEKGNQDTSC